MVWKPYDRRISHYKREIDKEMVTEMEVGAY
jgi:hypothetical protein